MPDDLTSLLPHDTVIVKVPVDLESLPGYIVIMLEKKEGAATPPAKGEFGIDVSRHQGFVDWDKVAAVPVAFAGIRATMGTGKDEQFARNWAEAKRVGIQRLAYHYFTNNFPALPQLDNFLKVLGDDLGELPLICDVEPTSGQVIANKTANTTEILRWLAECEARTGKVPAIYTNGWAWSACTTVPGWSEGYPLWLAQYTTAPAPIVPKPWTRYMAWQYSSTGRVSGVAKPDGTPINVDLNRWGEL